MNKKIIETISFLCIIIIFIIIGYYTYQSYIDKRASDDDAKINNFYNVEYLFNSGYITVPNTIDDFGNKDAEIYIYLDADNTMYIKYKDNEKKNKKVTGLSNEDITIYYNHLYEDYYEFLGKTKDNKVYYSYVDINDAKDNKFSLLGSMIDKVYIPVYDKKQVYINHNNYFSTNYILLDTDGNLKYIDYVKSNKYLLKNDIILKKPYFDYICASSNSLLCNYITLYITFNNELVYDGEMIKNKDGDIIYVNDAFSTFEFTSDKKINNNNISKELLKKYKFSFITYAIDDKKDLYKITILNNKLDLEKLTSDSNKVKEYVYEKDNSKLTIVFDDGTMQIVEGNENRELLTSTIYDKNSNNNEKVLIKP